MTIEPQQTPDWCARTALLIGAAGIARLAAAKVLIVGLGGVGAYAAELICRAGVGSLTIVDGDVVELSNRNRQLPALITTEGRPKSEVVAERLRAINPAAVVTPIHEFLRDEGMRALLCQPFDYVVDAIDTLSPKAYLAGVCLENGLRLVSSMGSGGKLDPGQVRVADISESYQCRLARALRKRLRHIGAFGNFKVVFSPEETNPDSIFRLADDERPNQKSVVGTVSYMPAIFGCFCASAVIRDLIADVPLES